jgi:hypothetical protein
MGVRDVRRERAARRICEGATATVVGGLILWSLTSSMSRPAPAQPAVAANVPVLAVPALGEAAAPRPAAALSIPASTAAPAAVMPLPIRNMFPCAAPAASVLLHEDFSRFREGDVTDWGPNTFVKTGLDRRNWLVSNVDGMHPVGRTLRLPETFSFECRYSAYLPEVTRGVLGWWKEPVTARISFLNDQGMKYTIEWVIRFGNDPTQLSPLGSSSLYVRKHYHTIRLPDGTAGELGIVQPTGVLRIDRNKNIVKVFLDGQPAVAGSIAPMSQLARFEIDVVKLTNGTLSFTDFNIAQ